MITSLLLWTMVTLVVITGYKLLIHATREEGMLSSQRGGRAMPERVQLVAASVAAAASYGAACLGTIGTGNPALVEPADWMIALVGGGNFVYLLGKSLRP